MKSRISRRGDQLSPRPHRALALNSAPASCSIPHNPATQCNKSCKRNNCTPHGRNNQNVIAAYNLAQTNGILPQTLYSSYSNLGRQQWTILTQPANTYGNSLPWMNAASNGYGAASANQTASLPRTGQMSGYSSLSAQGQQAIAAQGATVDLSDAVNASNLQTVGTIRANAPSAKPTSANSRRPRIPPILLSTPRWQRFSASTRHY